MYDDSPSTALYYLAIRAMYGEHPLRCGICGSKTSIAKLDAKSLYALYSAFYHPSRWRIFISGVFESAAVESVVERFVSQTPAPHLERCLDFGAEPKLPRQVSVCRRMRLHRPLFALGLKYEVSSGSAEERAREAIARDLMISALLGKSGTLYESLYDRGLVNVPPASTVESLPGASYLLITGESEDPDAVLDELTESLASAASGGVSKDDFERMQRVAYSDFLASLDSTEELSEGFASSVADGIDLFTYGHLLAEIDYEYAATLFARDFDRRRITRARLLPKR